MASDAAEELIECPRCDGLGWIEYADELGQSEYECPDCHGTGFIEKGVDKPACGEVHDAGPPNQWEGVEPDDGWGSGEGSGE